MTKGRNSDPIATIDVRCDDIDVGGAADLERAIAETGYGTFNVLLLVAALPVAWSGIFDTTTTAFVLISIECDLGATTLRKGVLASMPFLGMILGNVIWDRANPCVATRNLFILSLLADAALNVVSSAIDSYHAFLAIKFLTGILVAGPFSMVMQYLSEFHSAKYKASFARWAGLAVNAAIILPAALAFSIVPLSLDVEIFYRRYNSWRIYLLICSMVPLIGILTTSTLPHSPKYLVEIGRPDEALNLLRRMYSVNRWKSADTFPIETLLGSRTARASRRSFFKENSERLRLACYNTKVLFSAPYLAGVSRLGFLQFGSSLAFHTMRLWVPHTFMIISNFNGDAWTEDRPPLLADLLDRRNSLAMKDYVRCPNLYDVCAMWTVNSPIYMKSTIIAFSTVVVAFLAGTVTNTEFQRKTVLLAAFLIPAGSGLGLNWVPDPPNILTLAAAIIVAGKVASNVVDQVNVQVVPVPLSRVCVYACARMRQCTVDRHRNRD
nr:synaptic vesicle glycoprotein 2B-like isoform X2 [Nomia melanderi]